MHELSIAMQIVETSVAAIEQEPSAVVSAVHIRVGAMSNVVPRALQFAWGEATRGTRLDGAALGIEWVPAAVYCDRCNTEVELPGAVLKCTHCGAATPSLIRGKELEITTLELADEATHA